MNKIYKVIWSKARNCYVVVSELAKRNGKCKSVKVPDNNNMSCFTGFTSLSKVAIALLAAGMIAIPVNTALAANAVMKSPGGAAGTADRGVIDGKNSVAGGDTARVTGNNSVAIGYGATVNGNYAIALGNGAKASSAGAIAIGNNATGATGERSVAVGQYAVSSGTGSLAFQGGTAASTNSTAFGTGTKAGTYVDSITSYQGRAVSGFTTAYYNGQMYYRLTFASDGHTEDKTWAQIKASAVYSEVVRGVNATAFGNYTLASNDNATAFGHMTTASGPQATAFGFKTQATADNATAFGHQTKATANRATAFGIDTVAEGKNSTAFGYLTSASGENATSYGSNTQAVGGSSTAFGGFTEARAENSTAFGNHTYVSGGALKIGDKTYTDLETLRYTNENYYYLVGRDENGNVKRLGGKADDTDVITDGFKYETKNDSSAWSGTDEIGRDKVDEWILSKGGSLAGRQATAFGTATIATGNNATAFGHATLAGGRNTTAFGSDTQALGNNSVAWGEGSQTGMYYYGDHPYGYYAYYDKRNLYYSDLKIEQTKDENESNKVYYTLRNHYGETVADNYGSGATLKFNTYEEALASLKLTSPSNATAFGLESKTYANNSLAALGGQVGAIPDLYHYPYHYPYHYYDAYYHDAYYHGDVTVGENSAAIGKYAFVGANNSYAIGLGATVTYGSENSFATTGSGIFRAANSIAMGSAIIESSENSIATTGARIHSSANSIATGSAIIEHDSHGSVALGGAGYNHNYPYYYNRSTIINSLSPNSLAAVGGEVGSSSSNAIAFGGKVSDNASSAIAMGLDSSAEKENSVAIGSSSVAARNASNGGAGAGYDAATGTYYAGSDKSSATWTSTLAAVSIGGDSSNAAIGQAATTTRQLTGLAAGTADTDAVNVAQLKRAAALDTDNRNVGLFINADGRREITSPYIHIEDVDEAVGVIQRAANTARADAEANIAGWTQEPGESAAAFESRKQSYIEIRVNEAIEAAKEVLGFARAGSESAIALGREANASGQGAIAIGRGAATTKESATAIGTGASANLIDSVALGSNATTSPGTTVGNTTINNITFSAHAGHLDDTDASRSRVVSVGSAGAERQIQNVAAGEISSTSTDAVNGSQLYAVADQLQWKISTAADGGTTGSMPPSTVGKLSPTVNRSNVQFVAGKGIDIYAADSPSINGYDVKITSKFESLKPTIEGGNFVSSIFYDGVEYFLTGGGADVVDVKSDNRATTAVARSQPGTNADGAKITNHYIEIETPFMQLQGTKENVSDKLKAHAYGTASIAIGQQAIAHKESSIAIGHNTIAENKAEASTAIGYNTRTYGPGSVAIGAAATASGNRAISIGTTARNLEGSDLDTSNAHMGSRAAGQGSIALGDQAKAISSDYYANKDMIGSPDTTVNDAIAIGTRTQVHARNAIALGGDSSYSYYDDTNKLITVYGSDDDVIGGREFGAIVGEGAHSGIAIGGAYGTVNEQAHTVHQVMDAAATFGIRGIAIGTGALVANPDDFADLKKALSDPTYIKIKDDFMKARSNYFAAQTEWEAIKDLEPNDPNTPSGQQISISDKNNAKVRYDEALAEMNKQSAKYSMALKEVIRLQQQDSAKEIDAIAIGTLANASIKDSIALGSKSVTDSNDKAGSRTGISGYDPLGKASDNDHFRGDKVGGIEYAEDDPVWRSTAGSLSLGGTVVKRDNDGNVVRDDNGDVVTEKITRRISNVAAGVKDSDAVNVAQLKRATTLSTDSRNTALGVDSEGNLMVNSPFLAIEGVDTSSDFNSIVRNNGSAEAYKKNLEAQVAEIDKRINSLNASEELIVGSKNSNGSVKVEGSLEKLKKDYAARVALDNEYQKRVELEEQYKARQELEEKHRNQSITDGEYNRQSRELITEAEYNAQSANLITVAEYNQKIKGMITEADYQSYLIEYQDQLDAIKLRRDELQANRNGITKKYSNNSTEYKTEYEKAESYFKAQANAYGKNSAAMGSTAKAGGENALAIGPNNTVGTVVELIDFDAIKADTDELKAERQKEAANSVALGIGNKITGTANTESSTESMALGVGNTITNANNAMAIGSGNKVTGEKSFAIGTGHVVTGSGSGALGDPNVLAGKDSYVIGNNNDIGGTKYTADADAGLSSNLFVVGNENTIESGKEHIYVLGSNVRRTESKSVFLGDHSGYVADNNKTTKGIEEYKSYEGFGDNYEFAGSNPVGVVSVGDYVDDKQVTRRIQNVAAGLISADSTDAINGSQLYAAIQAMSIEAKDDGTTTKVDKQTTTGGGGGGTGTAATTYTVSAGSTTIQKTSENLSESGNLTIKDVKEGTATDPKSYEYKIDLNPDINVTSVTAGDTVMNTDGLTITGGPNGNPVTINNKEVDVAGNKIENVADGQGANDAVNVSQLQNSGISFKGDSGDSGLVNLGDKYNASFNVKGDDKNITTEASAGRLNIKLKEQIDLGENGSVTIGNTTVKNNSVAIEGGPSMTDKGIDAGGKKITNVEKGTDPKDAVNVSQLQEYAAGNNQAVTNLGNQITGVENRMKKGLAGAAALAALHPMDFDPDDKLTFAAGMGHYRGESAAALGMFYRPDEKVMFSVGGTLGNGENMINAGVSFSLDRTPRVTGSRTALTKEVVQLREHVAKQDAQIAELTALVRQLAGNAGLQVPASSALPTEGPALFADNLDNKWVYDTIEDLEQRGYFTGYAGRALTRQQIAAALDMAMSGGAKLDERIVKEFEPELSHVRVAHVEGKDNEEGEWYERPRASHDKYEDKHKIEKKSFRVEEKKVTSKS